MATSFKKEKGKPKVKGIHGNLPLHEAAREEGINHEQVAGKKEKKTMAELCYPTHSRRK